MDVEKRHDTKYERWYHLGLSIRFLLKWEREILAEGRSFDLKGQFIPPFKTNDAAREWLKGELAKGRDVIPPCSHVSNTGVCLGQSLNAFGYIPFVVYPRVPAKGNQGNKVRVGIVLELA